MKRILILIALAIIAILVVTFVVKRDEAGNTVSQEETDVRQVVIDFGDRLKDVALAAPSEQVAQAISQPYEPYVTDELLAQWTANPELAPGRLTSSPWPERIEIDSVEKEGDAYTVSGRIILMTSVEVSQGGSADEESVRLTVVPENGDWKISAFEAEQSADDLAYTHVDPGFRLLHSDAFTRFGGAPEGRDATFWSELSQAAGETYVTLWLPGEEGTNLSEARITVGSSDDAEAVAECTSPALAQGDAEEVEIHGVTFTKVTSSDAGAGNLYETTSYRTVHEGSCFAIETVIHSTQIANYPEGEVEEFDRAQLDALLGSVVESFSFI